MSADGPELRARISSAKQKRERAEKAINRATADILHARGWFKTNLAQWRLVFATWEKRGAERAEDKARNRLRGMVI